VQVIPTDLNAWLYQMERNIALFADLAGDAQLGQRFSQASQAAAALLSP
jgi:hypothetical protein